MKILPLTILSLFLPCAGISAQEQLAGVFPHPERICYDSHGLQIEGKDTFVYGGSFHYFRCPRELWPDRFQKLKTAGFNAVETYTPWNWHERQAPQSPEDFSKLIGMEDLEAWISMAESYGFYVIIRPGPYICAEWSGGGLPQWLVALKKPADWPTGKSWLQTDDPTWLAWSRHWYLAVCKVAAKHQITRKAPGQPGVILFQIENEYERLNWLPHPMKRRYLEALANDAREGGIDVPLFTCWTVESRNVKEGPLCGVFDMINQYPKWEVKKKMVRFAERQLKDQPDGPLMSAETQGGFNSDVGGKLSQQIDGIAPVQIQNLTLFELQLGFSLINYYMAFGGTNFDDWASRDITASYDFAAPIFEDGGVGEKYRRVCGIGKMLREHGANLMRSERVELESTISDPVVEIAERKAKDGSRYFFVRTEDRSGRHEGSAQIREKVGGASYDLKFKLEPFGSQVLYLRPGVADPAKGEWLPKVGADIKRPAVLPAAVVITQVLRLSDPVPEKWTSLRPGELLENHGVFDRHFLYYRVAPGSGQSFTVERIGDKVVNGTRADAVLAFVDGKLLAEKARDKAGVTFEMPAQAKEAVLLFESRGLHHHTNPVLEENWLNGIQGVKVAGNPLPLEFAALERDCGIQYSKSEFPLSKQWVPVKVDKNAAPAPEALLSWYRLDFELPPPVKGTWVSWHLHLEAQGNGFLYLNGRCIGRYWQTGPQQDFYLPESWLKFGPGKQNVVALSLRPVDRKAGLLVASVEPNTETAEVR